MTLYTIGHANLQLSDFFFALHSFEIQLLIDVRSVPYSKYHPDYVYTAFKKRVICEGIVYQYSGDQIGGFYSDKNLQFIDGGVEYAKVELLPTFVDGIDQVITLSNTYGNTVLMCVEKDPYFCHRFALISHVLSKKGIIPSHILTSENNPISNTCLEDTMRFEYGDTYSTDELYAIHNRRMVHPDDGI